MTAVMSHAQSAANTTPVFPTALAMLQNGVALLRVRLVTL